MLLINKDEADKLIQELQNKVNALVSYINKLHYIIDQSNDQSNMKPSETKVEFNKEYTDYKGMGF